MSDQFTGKALPLDSAGLDAATGLLQIGAAEIWTVLSVETSGVGFLADKRPKILFEGHIFSRLTGGRFDSTNPGISNPTPGGYGPGGANQYLRLNQAIALDQAAAIQSASWGIGQIMGFNFAAAGHASCEEMISAMMNSEDGQLLAMANFMKSENLDSALQRQDWAAFARGYNGPNYAENEYDTKLAAAHQQLAAGPLPDLEIRSAQLFLLYLGFDPGPIDGTSGPRTLAALAAFLAAQNRPAATGITPEILALLAQSAG